MLVHSIEYQSENSLNSIDYSDWFWTDIEVLTGGDDNAYSVEILADESNNIHIIWEDDTDDLAGSGNDRDIFYMNWNFASETWSSLEIVSTEGTGNCHDANFAVDSKGNVHVVWTDPVDILGAGIELDVWHRMRSPSGVWSSYTLISDASDEYTQEPRIVIDSADNIYIAWSDQTDVGDLGGVDSDVFYNMYDDESSTWMGMTLVSEDSSDSSVEIFLALDSKDFVHLIWTDGTDMLSAGTDYDIFYKKFLTSLTTWSTTQLVTTESPNHSRDARMCVDSEDSIHVFWQDLSDYEDSGTDYDIFYKAYDSLLSAWTTTEVISIYSDEYSALAVPVFDDKGTLHLVWEDQADYAGSGTDWDVVYQYKEKDSNIWSQLSLLSLDPDSDSYEPRICIDNLGHLHLIWYDNTDYLSSDADYDVFYRKLVGPPEATVLDSFVPDSIPVGNLTLTWQEVTSAENYEVYRENNYINSYSSLSPIAILADLQYTDTLNESGDYYYAVLATNRFGASEISNIESITILATTERTGLFQSFGLGETLVLAAILGGFQIIIATTIIFVFRNIPSQKPKTGKKK